MTNILAHREISFHINFDMGRPVPAPEEVEAFRTAFEDELKALGDMNITLPYVVSFLETRRPVHCKVVEQGGRQYLCTSVHSGFSQEEGERLENLMGKSIHGTFAHGIFAGTAQVAFARAIPNKLRHVVGAFWSMSSPENDVSAAA